MGGVLVKLHNIEIGFFFLTTTKNAEHMLFISHVHEECHFSIYFIAKHVNSRWKNMWWRYVRNIKRGRANIMTFK